MKQNFTSDHRKLKNFLQKSRSTEPQDVLKAMRPALQQVRKARSPRRALLLMTDAYFSGDLKQVAGTVSQAEVPIFALAMRGVDFWTDCALLHLRVSCLRNTATSSGPTWSAHLWTLLPNHTKPFLDTLANESGGRSTIFELDPRNAIRTDQCADRGHHSETAGSVPSGLLSRKPDKRYDSRPTIIANSWRPRAPSRRSATD